MSDQKHHTGDKFREVANELFDGNLSELARQLEMIPQAFQKYADGQRKPGAIISERLFGLGVNLNWFYSGRGPLLVRDLEPVIKPESSPAVQMEQRLQHYSKSTLTIYLSLMVKESHYDSMLKNLDGIEVLMQPINIETGATDSTPEQPASETDELT